MSLILPPLALEGNGGAARPRSLPGKTGGVCHLRQESWVADIAVRAGGGSPFRFFAAWTSRGEGFFYPSSQETGLRGETYQNFLGQGSQVGGGMVS